MTGHIDWSWWVFAPLWVPLAFAVALLLVFLMIALAVAAVQK